MNPSEFERARFVAEHTARSGYTQTCRECGALLDKALDRIAELERELAAREAKA